MTGLMLFLFWIGFTVAAVRHIREKRMDERGGEAEREKTSSRNGREEYRE